MPISLGYEGLETVEDALLESAQQVFGGYSSYDEYQDDPVGFINSVLGEFTWSKQQEVAVAVRDHRHVAVPSAHDMGKSFIAARIAAWWIASHIPGEAFVVSTAPTFKQVKNILWREINRAHRKGGLPGHTNMTEWMINGEVVGFGCKPADYDPDAFQGIHSKYVLVIIDEACGVPEAIWDAAETIVTNEFSRVLAIGNPDDPSAEFAKVCKPGTDWHVIHIDGLESPNFTDEDIPDYLGPLLLSPIWVQERYKKWGKDSAKVTSKVRGMFPEDAADGVVPLSLLARCAYPMEYPDGDLMPVELGVDVGAGGDETNIRERRGRKVGRVWKGHSPDTMVSAQLVLDVILETGATSVKVDVIGIGKGLTDRLKQWGREGEHPAEIHGVNVGEGAISPTEYQNLRCQIWWDIARGLSQDMIWDFSGLEEEDRDTLFSQLIAVKQRPPDGSGRERIEAKIDTKGRLGRSPDDADALLLAYYVPPPPEEYYVTTPETRSR